MRRPFFLRRLAGRAAAKAQGEESRLAAWRSRSSPATPPRSSRRASSSEKLKLGRPLRVKLGIDVTAPDVTLGNGVPLRRMRAFQDEGHIGVLIVGDYTTRIGDPSGRKTERPIIDPEVIDANAQRYFEAASTIIDPERTELRFNSEWLSKLDFAEILRLTRTTTVARILERDDFHKRFGANEPISISELLYPMMQAYDSVAVEADVELGGTDQTYNLLMGREVMAAYGLEPQVALTVAYLDSWDGTGMSASRGNYIGLREAPEEQFGKTMRIPDSLLAAVVRARDGGRAACRRSDGGEARARAVHRAPLARGGGGDAGAEEHFTRVVREGAAPDDVPEAVLDGRRRGASAGAPRRASRGRVDERGAAADLPGRRSR